MFVGNPRTISDLYGLYSDSAGLAGNAAMRDLIATIGTRVPKLISFADSPYQLTEMTGMLLVDATGGNVIVNLPTEVAVDGVETIVKKIDVSGNTATIQTLDGTTIDGAATKVLAAQWAVARLFPALGAWQLF